MASKILAAPFRFLRKTCGFALVMAACTATAYAGGPPKGGATPEIDPASIGAGLALLVGALLLIKDWRTNKVSA